MNRILLTLTILFLLFMVVNGQTQPSVRWMTVTTAGGCPTPTDLSATGMVWQLCGAPDGVYASVANNPTPVKLGGAAVTSVFGRTGAVTAATGDYSYSQLSGTAPVATVNGKTGNVVLSATIQ